MPLMTRGMSDIAIRFDGLLLATTLALATLIYLVVALAAGVVWLSAGRTGSRARNVARRSGLFSLLCLTAFGLVAALLATSTPAVQGTDWVDWLSFPAIMLFLIG